jgi:acetylglutamate kinase
LNTTISIQKPTLTIVKIGGNIIDDEHALQNFLQQFAAIASPKILVHGGGKLATRVAEAMGIQQQLIDGRRITDAETLKVVTMVYAGYINKNMVAQLQANNCNAIGVCGADAQLIVSKKREHPTIDYGFVGDIESVHTKAIVQLLQMPATPVFSAITATSTGSLLNTNADTIAQSIATALSSVFTIQLVYGFEKAGVLLDVANNHSVINILTPKYYEQLKKEEKIFAGMLPKLNNAFTALQQGVNKVIIGNALQLASLLNNTAGTTIQLHEQ